MKLDNQSLSLASWVEIVEIIKYSSFVQPELIFKADEYLATIWNNTFRVDRTTHA